MDLRNTIEETVLKSSKNKIFEICDLNIDNENFGNIVATDDSSFVEALGHNVSIVEGSYDNFKITTMIDYLLMKMLMEEIWE